MGFFKKLKKVVAGIEQVAPVVAGVLPGKAGQVAGDVGTATGVVTSIVEQIQSKSGTELSPEEAQKKATLTTAVAVDDHEERIKELEAALAALRGGSAGQSGSSGQSGSAGQSGSSGQSGSGGSAGKS